MPRPPRTLVLQQKSTTTVSTVASLNQISQIKTTNIKLQAVPPAQIQTIQKHTEHLREVTKKRASAEVSVKASSKGTEVHTPVRVEIPKPAEIHKAPVGAHAPPPRPTHPEPVQKSPPPPAPKGKAIEPKGKVIEKGEAEFKKPAAAETPAAPKGKPEPPAVQKGKPEPPAGEKGKPEPPAPKGKSEKKKDKDNPAAQADGRSGFAVASTQVDETPQIIVRWDDPLPGRRFQYNRRFPDIRTARIDVDDSL
jgi:hypothetical protein